MGTPARMTVHPDWQGDLRFAGEVGDTAIALDGDNEVAASPVQMLTTGLAGCMAIDVVHILARMRTPPDDLRVELVVERAATDPRRVITADMRFTIVGDVPAKNVQRALDMSTETYCSVWHSLRDDIRLATSFEVVKN